MPSGVSSDPAPWVAEGELRIREQGVEIVVGRHRSCCLEMRILPLVTVMIARSSRLGVVEDQVFHKGDFSGPCGPRAAVSAPCGVCRGGG